MPAWAVFVLGMVVGFLIAVILAGSFSAIV